MKRVFTLAVATALACLTAQAGVITLGTFSVNPQATFLNESASDSNVAALFIQLSSTTCGISNCVVAPNGAELVLIAGGNICFAAGPSMCGSAAGQIGAAFDANNTLTPSSPSTQNFNRLGGSINAGVGSIVDSNLNEFGSSISTNIPNDFFVPGGAGQTVFVPGGAQWLALGVLDSVFKDNSGSPTVTIEEIQAPAPEPATLGLLGAGLLGLAALRRRRAL